MAHELFFVTRYHKRWLAKEKNIIPVNRKIGAYMQDFAVPLIMCDIMRLNTVVLPSSGWVEDAELSQGQYS